MSLCTARNTFGFNKISFCDLIFNGMCFPCTCLTCHTLTFNVKLWSLVNIPTNLIITWVKSSSECTKSISLQIQGYKIYSISFAPLHTFLLFISRTWMLVHQPPNTSNSSTSNKKLSDTNWHLQKKSRTTKQNSEFDK